jgi:large subunit ribosomal protein L24
MQRIKRDDQVMVITGKDKGKAGRVLRVMSGGERVIVEKLNLVKRHSKPSQQNPQGGIVEKEAALHMSNVMLLTRENQPVRVGYAMKEIDGVQKKVRMAAQTNEAIDE